jgi:regulator of cell morphogenesis and NO signaling
MAVFADGPQSVSMRDVNESSPVGQTASHFPATIAVFEAFDIDYACKGGRSLAEAARAGGIETAALLAGLEPAFAGGPAPAPAIHDLLHTIVTEHHRFEGVRLRALATRFESAKDNSPAWRIRNLLLDLADSGSAHMLREERSLFPQLEQLDLHPHRIRVGSISGPLLNEFIEHDVVHERITKIRELALRLRARADWDVPLLDEIDELYRDVHRHMHLENNVLIPRAIDLENMLKSARRAELSM